MKYVPGLIPEHARVLPDYFKARPDTAVPEQKNLKNFMLWFCGILFCALAVCMLIHPLLFFLFGAIGFLLLPPGSRYLERKLSFPLTRRMKALACSLLFIGALALMDHYIAIEREDAGVTQTEEDTTPKQPAVAEPKVRHAKDSLNDYIRRSSELRARHKNADAEQQLEQAKAFADTENERNEVERALTDLHTTVANDLVKAGKYKAALPEIDKALVSGIPNEKLVYQRAVCKSRTGKVAEAVRELKPLMQAGNEEAGKLYDQINPVRKRIVGYETLCCDGTTSSARGRGACSWHGGVCDWNNPVYEEYRKYE